MSGSGSNGGGAGEEPEAGQRESRLRRRAALAATLVLAALVAAIVITSTSGSPEGESGTPQDCLDAWNFDLLALNFGTHNSIGHGYRDVQVGYMPQGGSKTLSADPDAGECAVVFAARKLDSEPQAAGEIHLGDEWRVLSTLLGSADLALLQRAAVAKANATVNQYGKLAAKPPR